MFDVAFYKRIQDALGTAEEGEALIEVARNAHKAEQVLAALNKEFILNLDATLESGLRKVWELP